MKINFATNRRARSAWCGVAASVGLLLSGAAALAQPFASPVGTTWDVTLSGARSGLGLIDFASDGTFTITEFLVPNPRSAGTSTSAIGRDGVSSRDGSVSSSSSSSSTSVEQTTIFGLETTSGRWGFNSQGNLIGFYGEVSGAVCTTNPVVITNFDGTIITNENVHCTFNTNEVSFTGKVVSGLRLTLAGTTGGRRTVYRGLPSITLTNIAGDWYGQRIAPGQTTTEFFTLTTPSSLVSNPNAYDVAGGGGNYSYSEGVALLSRWHKIAFVLALDD